ncbi:Neutral/alkaline nonlysosomal ceramidase [Dacryopinax primogenitus]|uniref:Neutral ceramidase n=1 Tax=Dacryopinax primogenitus (strain DJM 731) TaxID=1858805 RepID=M5G7R2_DACPD|nr:Neutral/alkaline nonlysosomal ceramidase [Dacryopinax primogenitus]EJU01922.1 Neutral/alkaline nonlysosomal ceramidase [Dacryopinax primogenitus]
MKPDFRSLVAEESAEPLLAASKADEGSSQLPLYTSDDTRPSRASWKLILARSIIVGCFLALFLTCYCFRSGPIFPAFNPLSTFAEQGATYQLGLGIADITGPIVEINMMGYADQNQLGTGLHMRLRARAFVVASDDLQDRWVLINADICMGDTAVRLGVLEKLAELYSGLYTTQNVAIVGTHSHAGVGGYLQNVLPQITSRGFVRESYDAIVQGIVLAVQRAHESLRPGNLELGVTTLLDTNINRSPYAYNANPEEERARYQYDQDKDFVLLRFGDEEGRDRGFASFFSVHGTSLYRNNTLISGDNKGMAAYLYESYMEPDTPPGNNTFVAGFFQASVGDTSPNTFGAFCETGADAGKPCSYMNSTCNGQAQGCQGRGPGWQVSDYESNRIIGYNQFQAARSVLSSLTRTNLSGNVRAVHRYVDMSDYQFKLSNGSDVSTCPPALGYSFAGGTSDGAGKLGFTQNRNGTETNPFWQYVKGAIGGTPTADQADCHFPKPILFNTGFAHTPYDWSPSIVDMQMFRIGQIIILIVPAEFTTMAGRRLMESVHNELFTQGVVGEHSRIILTGPANTYTHYVSTPEEYRIQRYEGASTLFGPWTLDAYKSIFTSLVSYVADTAMPIPDPGPSPPDLRSQQKSFHLPVVNDNAPSSKSFGTVLEDVEQNRTYHRGESVSARFQAANPRNNLRLEDTYLRVEVTDGTTWKTVRTDSHPSTVFEWTRTSVLLGTSEVKITWTVEDATPPGVYRLRYFGDSKSIFGRNTVPFEGVSSSFSVSL